MRNATFSLSIRSLAAFLVGASLMAGAHASGAGTAKGGQGNEQVSSAQSSPGGCKISGEKCPKGATVYFKAKKDAETVAADIATYCDARYPVTYTYDASSYTQLGGEFKLLPSFVVCLQK